MPFARFTFAPALPFRFHSRHSSAAASRSASLPYSLHPRGTGFGKRILRDNHPARLALSFALVVFLSVRDSANSSLRPTNRNTRLLAFFHAPSVSRSRYQNYRPSPSLSLSLFLLFFHLRPWTQLEWTTGRSHKIRSSFFMP